MLPRFLRFGGSEGPRAGTPAPLNTAIVLGVALAAAGCAARPPVAGGGSGPGSPPISATSPVTTPIDLVLVASAALATDTAFPSLGATRFGGISGCAWDEQERAAWVVSDDRTAPRVFRVDIDVVQRTLLVEPRAAIDLTPGPDGVDWPPVLDLEAIALDGPRLLVASEGDGSRRPRVPPAILAFDRDGRWLGQVPLPAHIVPEPVGEQRHGVRPNRAFESLALVGTDRLVAATEGPLVQDADGPGVDRGARVRWLVFERDGASWRHDRDWEYDLEAVRLQAAFGASEVEAGLVDLLALDSTRMLALERAFVRESGGGRRSTNHVEIYQVAIPAAGQEVRLLAKQRVLDLADMAPRLVPRLRNLDNFEAMCLGPTLADGARTLLLVSDNNFNARQTTGFVLLRIEEPRSGPDERAAVRVHVDTDAGPDDLAALAFLLARRGVEVTGVSLVEGLATPASGRERVARLLEAAGRADVPIGVPAEGQPAPPNRFPEAWRMLPASPATGSLPGGAAGDAAALIVAAMARGDRVLALGPLTNVATALDGRRRSGAGGRPPVTVMGGAIAVAGNVVAPHGDGRAEWNVFADPDAAAFVMARAAVTLVPLDATNQVPVTRAFIDDLASRTLSPLGRLAVEWLSASCAPDSCHDVYAWDPLAAVLLVEPSVRIDEDAASIEVVRQGPGTGRTVARGMFSGPHRIVRIVDRGAFTRAFVSAFDSP